MSVTIRCFDLVLLYLYSIVPENESEYYNPSPRSKKSIEEVVENDLDNSKESKEVSTAFFYRGSSISVQNTSTPMNTVKHEESAAEKSVRIAVNLKLYDIEDLIDFAICTEGGSVITGVPIKVLDKSNNYTTPENHPNEDVSSELKIILPVVTQLTPHPPQCYSSERSGGNSSRRTSRGLSTTVYGEQELAPLSKDTVLSGAPSTVGKHGPFAFSPHIHDNTQEGDERDPILISPLTPSAPTTERTTLSTPSPRPKSALVSARKSSYKYDTSYEDANKSTSLSLGHDQSVRPVTAPNKRVAFSLDRTSLENNPNSPDRDSEEKDETKLIYVQLMKDFDRHLRETSVPDIEGTQERNYFSELKPYNNQRRYTTNMYRSNAPAFKLSNTVSGGTIMKKKRLSEDFSRFERNIQNNSSNRGESNDNTKLPSF